MNQLDAEIFAVGKWNGMAFTLDDLHAMARTFAELRNNHRVPLKFGHNDKQPLTDGTPALGWVDQVWVTGDKLMAKFVDMPDIVMKCIKKKLYKNVSIELDMGVKYKGDHYPFILSGVALLGADIPAVNTLNDLTYYMSRSVAFSAGRHAVFTAIAGQSQTKEINMTLEDLTAKVAELTTSIATFTTENAKLKADNAELLGKVAKFSADDEARKAAEQKAAITAKRAEVTSILEEGVKSEAITPAQREQFSKLMRVDDDTAVMALDIAEVKKLTVGGKKQFGREQGRQQSGDSTTKSPAQTVDAEIKAMLAKGEAKTYVEAQSVLFTRNPELARAYVNSNDEEQ